MKGYGKFLDGIEKIEKLFLAVTVAIMIIVITYQVILRYVFSASNAWSEELARYLFIYDVMVAAAIATRRNSHLQVDAFIGILKPRTKAIYTVIATIVGIPGISVLLFCCIVSGSGSECFCRLEDSDVCAVCMYADWCSIDDLDLY